MRRYDIDIAEIIGRLIPFYARGRKILMLLQAIAHPIEQLHKIWVKWAKEMTVEASVTSQPLSLAWYLNHKLRDRFVNEDDTFVVYNGLGNPTNMLFCESEYLESDSYSKHVYGYSEENAENLTMVTKNADETDNNSLFLSIIAPAINETVFYDNSDYRHEIKSLVDKYNDSLGEFQIII